MNTPDAQDIARRQTLRLVLNSLKQLLGAVPAEQGWSQQNEDVSGLRGELLESFEDVDVVATCEGCSDGILHGEMGTTTLDGCSLCADCTPTWADCKAQWDEFPNQGDDGDYACFQAAYRAHISGGGTPEDKPLFIMGDTPSTPADESESR